MTVCQMLIKLNKKIVKDDALLDQKALTTSKTDEVSEIIDIDIIDGKLVIITDNGRS